MRTPASIHTAGKRTALKLAGPVSPRLAEQQCRERMLKQPDLARLDSCNDLVGPRQGRARTPAERPPVGQAGGQLKFKAEAGRSGPFQIG